MASSTQQSTERDGAGSKIDRSTLGVILFLVAAGASFLLSIGLWFSGSHDEGVYVGLWVPSILAAGAFWISALGRTS